MKLRKQIFTFFCWILLQSTGASFETKGLLYPKTSETREVLKLDGLWNFVQTNKYNLSQGITEKWFTQDLSLFPDVLQMPVPASYNDMTEEQSLRDNVGPVWYDTKFFTPLSWRNALQKVWIRFGSVRYEAQVWLNGEFVVKHEIGGLPFEVEITDKVKYGEENRLTVQVDNRLGATTIPQGSVSKTRNTQGDYYLQSYSFDFFHYAGIDRSVMIFTTPSVHITDVFVQTDLVEGDDSQHMTGILNYEVTSNDVGDSVTGLKVQIRNKKGEIVANENTGSELQGTLKIENVKPWWPYLMDPEPGYLYTMEILLTVNGTENADIYRLKIGFRTLQWDNKSFLINGKPIYFRGFGKHEDTDIKGKGLDLPLIAKDFSLLKWIGANAFRTSHYPYSEESMDIADEQGIMIIDECPAVNIDGITAAGSVLLQNHKSSIEQMIHRDKNHPSIVMWSIANEPKSKTDDSGPYFDEIATYTKTLDSTRPVTAVLNANYEYDKAGQFLDIISFNRYNGWYDNPGRLSTITGKVTSEAAKWHELHNKPIIHMEYGADTMEGLHIQPAYLWSEEYQKQTFMEHFKAFDQLRKEQYFIGEFIWCFADFMTAPTDIRRVGGNKKGVFTRNRQPKSSAYIVRERYFALAQELNNATLPEDLFSYVTELRTAYNLRDLSEL